MNTITKLLVVTSLASVMMDDAGAASLLRKAWKATSRFVGLSSAEVSPAEAREQTRISAIELLEKQQKEDRADDRTGLLVEILRAASPDVMGTLPNSIDHFVSWAREVADEASRITGGIYDEAEIDEALADYKDTVVAEATCRLAIELARVPETAVEHMRSELMDIMRDLSCNFAKQDRRRLRRGLRDSQILDSISDEDGSSSVSEEVASAKKETGASPKEPYRRRRKPGARLPTAFLDEDRAGVETIAKALHHAVEHGVTRGSAAGVTKGHLRAGVMNNMLRAVRARKTVVDVLTAVRNVEGEYGDEILTAVGGLRTTSAASLATLIASAMNAINLQSGDTTEARAALNTLIDAVLYAVISTDHELAGQITEEVTALLKEFSEDGGRVEPGKHSVWDIYQELQLPTMARPDVTDVKEATRQLSEALPPPVDDSDEDPAPRRKSTKKVVDSDDDEPAPRKSAASKKKAAAPVKKV
ncbi:MAG: hypothetical protein LBR78_02850, partial [Holosporales bacterium]|nr:hypothetical protein [Holosporales bacterium]